MLCRRRATTDSGARRLAASSCDPVGTVLGGGRLPPRGAFGSRILADEEDETVEAGLSALEALRVSGQPGVEGWFLFLSYMARLPPFPKWNGGSLQ